jgi:hypothetical protein
MVDDGESTSLSGLLDDLTQVARRSRRAHMVNWGGDPDQVRVAPESRQLHAGQQQELVEVCLRLLHGLEVADRVVIGDGNEVKTFIGSSLSGQEDWATDPAP